MENIREKFRELGCCVLIPTYNNAKTLATVIHGVLKYTDQVIIVNDGATDQTSEILAQMDTITVVNHPQNQGKGVALQTGFSTARSMGFTHLISIDSDGQHDPDDLPLFIEALEKNPQALVVGARNMDQETVPGGSSFGHKFSNFWFKLETGVSLPDTQSGYRLYPLKLLENIRFFTPKFEFEIEILVRASWRGIALEAIPVRVYYQTGEDRVSHFRPYKDFARISYLNAVLVVIALFYIKPRDFIRDLRKKNPRQIFRDLFANPEESNLRKSTAVGFGIFMGVVPLWGFQLVSAIGLAHFFKLNKGIVILAAQVSLPPFIPLLLFLSYKTGALFLGKAESELAFSWDLTVQQCLDAGIQYVAGAFILAVILGLLIGGIAWILLVLFRKEK